MDKNLSKTKIILYCIPLIFYNGNFIISSMIFNYYLKYRNDYDDILAFSIANIFSIILYNCFGFGFSELIGSKVTKYYGSNKIKKCTEYYVKCLLFLVLLSIIFAPLFYFWNRIMVALGNDLLVSYRLSEFMIKFYWVIFLMNLNRINEFYNFSQNNKAIIIISSLINLSLLPISSYYFIVKFDLSLNGIIYAKLIQEGVNFIVNILNLIFFCKFEKIQFKDIFNRLWKFILLLKNIIFSLSMDYFNFQIITIFLSYLKLNTDIIIWNFLFSYIGLSSFSSYSFSNAIQIYCGYYLGKNNIKNVKSFWKIILLITFILSIIQILFVFIFDNYLSKLFTNNKKLETPLKYIFKVYALFIINDFHYSIFASILRLFKKERIQTLISFLFNGIMVLILSYTLIIYFNLKLLGAIITIIISGSLANISQIIIFWKIDYSKFINKLNIEDDIEESKKLN